MSSKQMTKHLQEEHCTITPLEGETSEDPKENGMNAHSSKNRQRSGTGHVLNV
jgi:hypothetical protein